MCVWQPFPLPCNNIYFGPQISVPPRRVCLCGRHCLPKRIVRYALRTFQSDGFYLLSVCAMFFRFCLTSCAFTSNAKTENYPRPSTNSSSQHRKLQYGSFRHTEASARITCLSSHQFSSSVCMCSRTHKPKPAPFTALLLGVGAVPIVYWLQFYLPTYFAAALQKNYHQRFERKKIIWYKKNLIVLVLCQLTQLLQLQHLHPLPRIILEYRQVRHYPAATMKLCLENLRSQMSEAIIPASESPGSQTQVHFCWRDSLMRDEQGENAAVLKTLLTWALYLSAEIHTSILIFFLCEGDIL